jgi:hypothetical protein
MEVRSADEAVLAVEQFRSTYQERLDPGSMT